MKLEISEFCGSIFLTLQNNLGACLSIVVLSKGGIEKCFVEGSIALSTEGNYIADEDSD